MNLVAAFSETYAQARTKFLGAVRALGLEVESASLSGHTGIDGEPLAMDVTMQGDAQASGMLVLTSATHGIEGYCGSGCEIGLLRDAEFAAAVARAKIAVLFVHAINPHGFSWGRRVNEDNVDLNRNFRDFARTLPDNKAYAEVHPLLLPGTWPPPPENEQRINAYVTERGLRAFQSAVTGGQHTFPDGLFFGGVQPTWSNRTLRALLRRHAANRARLAWIDFHTGLGPSGHGEKIHAGRNDAADLARTRRCFGADVTSIHDGSSASAEVTGMLTTSGWEECPGAEMVAIGLEYGTVPLPEVLLALRADHWLHKHPDAPAPLRATVARQMRAAFCGDTDEWKTIVYQQAKANALKAVAHLSGREA